MIPQSDKILYLYAWDEKDTAVLEHKLASGNWQELHVLYYVEYDVYFENTIVKLINQHNITLKVSTCAFDSSWLFNRLISIGIRADLINIQLWPTYWFNNVDLEMETNQNLYYNKHIPKHFNYPYLTFNTMSRAHRTMLIDLLYKNDLLSKGVVTYHQARKKPEHLQWRYYNGDVLTINDGYLDHHSSYRFNSTYVTSFLHIPTETTIDTPFISEKTATPILCRLPFLTLGPQHFHRDCIQKLGFELYDEIFDYSFDSEPDLELRIEKLLLNVKMVCEHPNVDELYQKIKDKCDRNYYRALRFTYDDSYIPQIVRNRLKYIASGEIKDQNWDYVLQRVEKKISYSKNLFYNVWHNIDTLTVIKDVEKHNPQEVTFFGETEYEISIDKSLVEFLQNKNISMKFVHGGCKSQYYTNLYNKLQIDHNCVSYWETYWMNDDEILLTNGGCDHRTYNVNTNFKFSYINLNNKGHQHRCALIDQLSKNELLDAGVVSWHNFGNINNPFPFKHYDGSLRILTDEFNVKLDPAVLPAEFHQSFFHLVSESTVDTPFITEKTIFPIMLKKPFASMASVHFHAKLVELGFELYDELIDYSFDTIEDVEQRAAKLVENVKRISELPNLAEAYENLRPKLLRNYENYLRIIKSKDYIPNEILRRVEYLRTNPNAKFTGQDNKYLEIINILENKQ